MYDLIDRRVCDLSPFEHDVLVAIRRWTHAMTMLGRQPRDMNGSRFSDAMTILHDRSTDTLVIRPPCHDTVDDAEAVIVALWRLVRDQSTERARGIAEALVGPAGSRMIQAIERAILFA